MTLSDKKGRDGQDSKDYMANPQDSLCKNVLRLLPMKFALLVTSCYTLVKMVRLATDCWLLTPTTLCHFGSVLEIRLLSEHWTIEIEVISDSDHLHKDLFQFILIDCHGSNIHALSV